VVGISNNCEASDSVTLFSIEASVKANAGQDTEICEGSSTILTATGGSTYLWSTGAKTASITVSPNQTTTYTVTAYDSTGKNPDKDDVVVKVNPLPKVSAGSNVSINSGETTTLTATGASIYKWSTGDTGATIKVRPTSTMTYTVTGIENGCEATSTVKVTVSNTVGVTANAGEDQNICEGNSATLTAKGGSTYLWSTGEKTASIKVSPKETTTYSVKVYDATGKNSDTDEVIVTVNLLPKVSAGKDVTINSGESTTLTAAGAKYYSWNTGIKSSSITVSPKKTTTYTVQGKNDDECEVTATVKVVVIASSEVTVDANAGEDQSICQGSSASLTATGGSTYLWSTGGRTATISVSPNATKTYTVTAYDSTGKNFATDDVIVRVNPLPTLYAGKETTINLGESTTLKATGSKFYSWNTGVKSSSITVSPKTTTTYTVQGKNDDECVATATVKVIVIDSSKVTLDANAGKNQTICQGSSTTLTATGGSTYLWNTGATTAKIKVAPNKTTTYTVTVSDSTGSNSETAKVTVTVNLPPIVDAGKNVTIKLGESTTLTAKGASGYSWNTGATSASIKVSPTATRTYKVTGTKNGCEATSTVKVTVLNSSRVVAHGGGNKDVCAGSEVTLTASGGDTYLWNTGARTASITVSPEATAKYSVTAYVGDASDTDEVVVNVSPLPDVAIKNGSEATVLEGEFITLSATGAKTYQWSNGATQPNIAVRPNLTKTYSVTGHVNKCSAQRSVKVNVFEKIIADAGSDVTITRDETTVLTATGPKNSEFLWSTGETTKSITVSPKSDTEYSVMVYHALDSDTANVMVKVIDLESQIIEDSVALEFMIHPNPTDGEIHIKISGLTNLSSIHLYDLSGKSLYKEIINKSDQQRYTKTLNLSDFASGIYLLQLIDNERIITKKVILR
ncbi:MAG: T9SS type A sorting domain-containing protein, partial [Gelidibacter sp.]